MKLETKLLKILIIENDNLKKLMLQNLAFKCFPGSNEQKKVISILNNL